MPIKITKSTPREDVTIKGATFKVPSPFAEGHVLTSKEADVLNQTYHENVRNNRAKSVDQAKTAGTFDQAAMQAEIDKYCETYDFGVRVGGFRTGDPIERASRQIAKTLVINKLKQQGVRIKDVDKDKMNEFVTDAIAKYPQIRKLAEDQVKQQEALAQAAS